MHTMPDQTRRVALGIDTHRDEHVCSVLDERGVVLDVASFATTEHGYRQLLEFAGTLGTIDRIGIEGTGTWGKGLARFCLDRGLAVVDVNRPNRQARRRHGKTDQVDAIAAARAVLSGEATTSPKTSNGTIEMLRMVHNTRESAVKHRTQAKNQIQSLARTAPVELADQLRGLSTNRLITTAIAFDTPTTPRSPADMARSMMQSLAHRIRFLDDEIVQLDQQRNRLVRATAPALLALPGVGFHSASILLVTAGDNPDRIATSNAWAKLCGVAVVACSSGQTRRFRLDRGGNRQANRALHTIAISRLRYRTDATTDYVKKRQGDGNDKATSDTIRRLKRALARETYPYVMAAITSLDNLPQTR